MTLTWASNPELSDLVLVGADVSLASIFRAPWHDFTIEVDRRLGFS